MKSKIIIGLLLSLCGLFYWQFSDNGDENFIAINGSNTPTDEEAQIHLNVNQEQLANIAIKSKKQPLHDYIDIEKFHALDFSDDWCIASLDLTKKGYQIYEEKRKEWSLEIGTSRRSKKLQPNRRDSEGIDLYDTVDIETLIEYSKNDDILAMSLLLSRAHELTGPPKDIWKLTDEIANELFIREGTSISLQEKVITEMTKASLRYQQKRKVDDVVIEHVLSALTYVGYGLEQNIDVGLVAYLEALIPPPYSSYDNEDQSLETFNPDSFLTDTHIDSIPYRVKALRYYVNQERENRFLQPLKDINDLPKISKHNFDSNLAFLPFRYGDDFFEFKALSAWSDSLLKKTECRKRLMAYHKPQSLR